MAETSVPQTPISVLLVDDHLVVREGLRTMLAKDRGVEVVGEASSGEEAIQKVDDLHPQVVLMDIRLPGMSGIEAAQQVKEAHAAVSVIVLTMYDSEMYVIEAIRAGAAGYLTKDCSRELLSHAIRSVVEGGTLVRGELLRHAIEGLPRGHRNHKEGEAGSPGMHLLTERELEVLRLVTEGFVNKQIARKLVLAEVTVKKHIQSIMAKLGASDRTHAAILAIRLGLVE